MNTHPELTTDHCTIPVLKSPKDYPVFRISPHDTNRLAIVFDSTIADDSLTICVEIFDPGGRTPTHRHNFAVEMFYILKGEGEAILDEEDLKVLKKINSAI
jgi:quercetin dioxygenase-like cupin family protein